MGVIAAGASFLGNLISTWANNRLAKKQYKRDMNSINSLGTYTSNPLADQELAMAQNLYNGRMAGASSAENEILQNAANASAGVDNTATDAAQALAVKAAITGQAGDSFADLAKAEAMDRMNRAGLVRSAIGTKITEGDKVWGDKLRKLKQEMGVGAVFTQNKSNVWQGAGDSVALFGNMLDYMKKDKKSGG